MRSEDFGPSTSEHEWEFCRLGSGHTRVSPEAATPPQEPRQDKGLSFRGRSSSRSPTPQSSVPSSLCAHAGVGSSHSSPGAWGSQLRGSSAAAQLPSELSGLFCSPSSVCISPHLSFPFLFFFCHFILVFLSFLLSFCLRSAVSPTPSNTMVSPSGKGRVFTFESCPL